MSKRKLLYISGLVIIVLTIAIISISLREAQTQKTIATEFAKISFPAEVKQVQNNATIRKEGSKRTPIRVYLFSYTIPSNNAYDKFTDALRANGFKVTAVRSTHEIDGSSNNLRITAVVQEAYQSGSSGGLISVIAEKK